MAPPPRNGAAPRLRGVDSPPALRLVPDQATQRAEAARATVALLRSLTFRLDVPGRHYGGLTNQELFDLLAAQGRDFDAPSRELADHIRLAVLAEFAQATRPPTLPELLAFLTPIVVEWVAARMEGTRRDVRIAPLAPATVKFKRANGFDPRPGIMRGDLLEAVRSAGLDAR